MPYLKQIAFPFFWVRKAMHVGIDGYFITGINNILTNIVFIFGVNLLNLPSFPLFIVFVIWAVNQCSAVLASTALDLKCQE